MSDRSLTVAIARALGGPDLSQVRSVTVLLRAGRPPTLHVERYVPGTADTLLEQLRLQAVRVEQAPERIGDEG
jgi:hypothetical protein